MKNINLNLISDFLNEHAFSNLDKDLPVGGKQKFYENLDGILSQSFEQTLSEASLLESSYLEGQLNLDKTFSPPPQTGIICQTETKNLQDSSFIDSDKNDPELNFTSTAALLGFVQIGENKSVVEEHYFSDENVLLYTSADEWDKNDVQEIAPKNFNAVDLMSPLPSLSTIGDFKFVFREFIRQNSYGSDQATTSSRSVFDALHDNKSFLISVKKPNNVNVPSNLWLIDAPQPKIETDFETGNQLAKATRKEIIPVQLNNKFSTRNIQQIYFKSSTSKTAINSLIGISNYGFPAVDFIFPAHNTADVSTPVLKSLGVASKDVVFIATNSGSALNIKVNANIDLEYDIHSEKSVKHEIIEETVKHDLKPDRQLEMKNQNTNSGLVTNGSARETNEIEMPQNENRAQQSEKTQQLRLEILSRNWETKFFSQVLRASKNGIEKLDLVVHPKKLGAISINIVTNGDIVKVKLFSENATVASALHANEFKLETFLAEHGMKLASFSSSFESNSKDRREHLFERSIKAGVLKKKKMDKLADDEPITGRIQSHNGDFDYLV